MATETTIRVNFGKPMPVFPLNNAVLMPHGILPLHIFEDRYKQMVADALDGSGQIAMAVFEGPRWKQEYHGRPPIRPAVCVGHIIQHFKLPNGNYNIALQGVCRAKILQELPAKEGRLYREALLEPVGVGNVDESTLAPFRQTLSDSLSHEPLSDLRGAAGFVEHLNSDDVPTSAILELLALAFLGDSEVRYELLASANPEARARIVSTQLADLERLLKRAAPQRQVETPKGCNWN